MLISPRQALQFVRADFADRGPERVSGVKVEYEKEHSLVWVKMVPSPGEPVNFSPRLLEDFERTLTDYEARVWAPMPI